MFSVRSMSPEKPRERKPRRLYGSPQAPQIQMQMQQRTHRKQQASASVKASVKASAKASAQASASQERP